jgi:hypothetical protein
VEGLKYQITINRIRRFFHGIGAFTGRFYTPFGAYSRNCKDQVENNWQYCSVLSLKPQGNRDKHCLNTCHKVAGVTRLQVFYKIARVKRVYQNAVGRCVSGQQTVQKTVFYFLNSGSQDKISSPALIFLDCRIVGLARVAEKVG